MKMNHTNLNVADSMLSLAARPVDSSLLSTQIDHQVKEKLNDLLAEAELKIQENADRANCFQLILDESIEIEPPTVEVTTTLSHTNVRGFDHLNSANKSISSNFFSSCIDFANSDRTSSRKDEQTMLENDFVSPQKFGAVGYTSDSLNATQLVKNASIMLNPSECAMSEFAKSTSDLLRAHYSQLDEMADDLIIPLSISSSNEFNRSSWQAEEQNRRAFLSESRSQEAINEEANAQIESSVNLASERNETSAVTSSTTSNDQQVAVGFRRALAVKTTIRHLLNLKSNANSSKTNKTCSATVTDFEAEKETRDSTEDLTNNKNKAEKPSRVVANAGRGVDGSINSRPRPDRNNSSQAHKISQQIASNKNARRLNVSKMTNDLLLPSTNSSLKSRIKFMRIEQKVNRVYTYLIEELFDPKTNAVIETKVLDRNKRQEILRKNIQEKVVDEKKKDAFLDRIKDETLSTASTKSDTSTTLASSSDDSEPENNEPCLLLPGGQQSATLVSSDLTGQEELASQSAAAAPPTLQQQASQQERVAAFDSHDTSAILALNGRAHTSTPIHAMRINRKTFLSSRYASTEDENEAENAHASPMRQKKGHKQSPSRLSIDTQVSLTQRLRNRENPMQQKPVQRTNANAKQQHTAKSNSRTSVAKTNENKTNKLEASLSLAERKQEFLLRKLEFNTTCLSDTNLNQSQHLKYPQGVCLSSFRDVRVVIERMSKSDFKYYIEKYKKYTRSSFARSCQFKLADDKKLTSKNLRSLEPVDYTANGRASKKLASTKLDEPEPNDCIGAKPEQDERRLGINLKSAERLANRQSVFAYYFKDSAYYPAIVTHRIRKLNKTNSYLYKIEFLDNDKNFECLRRSGIVKNLKTKLDLYLIKADQLRNNDRISINRAAASASNNATTSQEVTFDEYFFHQSDAFREFETMFGCRRGSNGCTKAFKFEELAIPYETAAIIKQRMDSERDHSFRLRSKAHKAEPEQMEKSVEPNALEKDQSNNRKSIRRKQFCSTTSTDNESVCEEKCGSEFKLDDADDDRDYQSEEDRDEAREHFLIEKRVTRKRKQTLSDSTKMIKKKN